MQYYLLTLRETSALTNLIAATTRYFSLLFVRYRTLSITLLRRKSHLQRKWKIDQNRVLDRIDIVKKSENLTLSCKDAAQRRNIANHRYLTKFQASRIFDSWVLQVNYQTCCQDHHNLTGMMIMHQLTDSSVFRRKSPQYFLSAKNWDSQTHAIIT